MKEALLNKSNAILKSVENTIESFYILYNSLDESKEKQKQDLLRSIILFSCSGIDAIVKQLITDTLDYVIEHDEGAFNNFKKFVENKLSEKKDMTINSKLLADLFTCKNPQKTLIDLLKRDLSNNSLQSAEELLKVGSYFNIDTANLVKGKSQIEKLKEIFIARNQITHEMDVNMNVPTFELRERTIEEVNDYSECILSLSKNYIKLVSEKLEDTSEINEIDQIASL